MNCKSMFIFAVLLFIIVTATPFSLYAKEYHSSVQLTASLQNECSSEDSGNTNCANNNVETFGDENVISPQITQSSQTKTGEGGQPGPSPEPLASTLFYTVAEVVPPSDIVLNRIGGLADPYKVELNSDFEDSENPTVAVSGNNVYVVWDSDSSEILYRRSLDGGASFGDVISLSDGIIETTAKSPVAGVAGNSVYVVWSDEDAILLRKSTDGGASFGPPIPVSTTAASSNAISMAVVGNVLYLAWSENITGQEEGLEIFFSKSTDGGITFSEKQNLSQNDDDSNNPSIAVYRDKVHVVWSDQSVTPSHFSEILYRRSLDGGQTFETAKNLSNNPSSSFQPTIAAFEDRLYIAWSDNSAGNLEILVLKSKNGGSTFDAVERLSNNPGDSRSPRIAVSQNEVYVVWAAPGGIFFIRSVDGGIAFGAATIIIPDGSDLAIAVSQNLA